MENLVILLITLFSVNSTHLSDSGNKKSHLEWLIWLNYSILRLDIVAAQEKITEVENYKAFLISGNTHCLILRGTCELNNPKIFSVSTCI